MHPWIAQQANHEHLEELRSLGRPFTGSPRGRRIGRRRVGRDHPQHTQLAGADRRGRMSLGF